MFKKAEELHPPTPSAPGKDALLPEQDRSEQGGEAYSGLYVEASERCENKARAGVRLGAPGEGAV